MKPTRDDLAAYAMGTYDGAVAALEAALAADEALRAQLAEEAELELLLRDAAAAATFCPACDDLVRGARCGACGAAVRPGGYVIEKVLVANAHGRMYVARDADGKQVALKELAFVQSPGPDAVAAFEREAKFLRALEHAAIPRFVAAFEEGEGVGTRYYLAQELVAGESLEARLDEHFYSEAEIVALARAVLEVLVYLQGLSPMVIHRDIKPANLIRRADGSIALVDFGAAHVQGTTAGSTSIGTFGYMPIEQLAGQVDATTDGYALGASLIHLLTRQEPWRVMNAELIGTINVSAPLRRFLEKLVAPRREDRYPNAAAALSALEQRDALPAPKKKRDWRVPLVALLGTTAVAAAGAAGYALHGSGGPEDSSTASLALPAPCVAYAHAVDRVRGCSALPEATRTRLISGAEALLDPSALRTRDDIEQRAERCTAASHDVEREAGAVCGLPEAAACSNLQALSARVMTCEAMPQPARDRLLAAIDQLLAARDRGGLSGQACTDVYMQVEGQLASLCPTFGASAWAWGSGWGNHPFPITPTPPTPPAPPPPPVYANQRKVTLEAKAAQLADALRSFGKTCATNVVVPDYIKATVTVRLDQVPCDRAIETMLEAHGLWYRYIPEGNLLEVLPRRQIDREDEEAFARAGDELPAGKTIDLDLKDAPLPDVLRMLANAGGVNLVIPDSVSSGKVTVRLAKVRWDHALRAVLGAHGLGYRYKPEGRIVRVGPARELQAEDEAARAREERDR